MYAGLSPYNYCLNNPVNVIDPDGGRPLAQFDMNLPANITALLSRTGRDPFAELDNALEVQMDNESVNAAERNAARERFNDDNGSNQGSQQTGAADPCPSNGTTGEGGNTAAASNGTTTADANNNGVVGPPNPNENGGPGEYTHAGSFQESFAALALPDDIKEYSLLTGTAATYTIYGDYYTKDQELYVVLSGSTGLGQIASVSFTASGRLFDLGGRAVSGKTSFTKSGNSMSDSRTIGWASFKMPKFGGLSLSINVSISGRVPHGDLFIVNSNNSFTVPIRK